MGRFYIISIRYTHSFAPCSGSGSLLPTSRIGQSMSFFWLSSIPWIAFQGSIASLRVLSTLQGKFDGIAAFYKRNSPSVIATIDPGTMVQKQNHPMQESFAPSPDMQGMIV